jgi:hypothetical protein
VGERESKRKREKEKERGFKFETLVITKRLKNRELKFDLKNF